MDSAESAPVRSLGALRGTSYPKGRGLLSQVLWVALSRLVVVRVWCPNSLRCSILRGFGARIGSGVLIKHDVDIKWPWRLAIGNDSWLGVGVNAINNEQLTIGSNVCISQEVFLCTGSHDFRSPTFAYDNGPIVIEDGVWVGAKAVVLRGVTVGARSVVGAHALIVSDVPADSLASAPLPVIRKIMDRSKIADD